MSERIPGANPYADPLDKSYWPKEAGRLAAENAYLNLRIRELETEVALLREVAKAAGCIRHWHDASNGGMVVSGEHVRKLWAALNELDATLKKEDAE